MVRPDFVNLVWLDLIHLLSRGWIVRELGSEGLELTSRTAAFQARLNFSKYEWFEFAYGDVNRDWSLDGVDPDTTPSWAWDELWEMLGSGPATRPDLVIRDGKVGRQSRS